MSLIWLLLSVSLVRLDRFPRGPMSETALRSSVSKARFHNSTAIGVGAQDEAEENIKDTYALMFEDAQPRHPR